MWLHLCKLTEHSECNFFFLNFELGVEFLTRYDFKCEIHAECERMKAKSNKCNLSFQENLMLSNEIIRHKQKVTFFKRKFTNKSQLIVCD